MTNRRRAGILSALALTLPLTPTLLPAADGVLAASAADKSEQVREAKFDLGRDLANRLVRPEGMEFKPHSLTKSGKIDYYVVYFGAHWCPNSKKFTPKLTEFYREQRAAHRNFEVIFVSADKDEQAMLQYMNGYKMPWPAVKFAGHKEIKSLKALAGRGYPCVALVDAHGKLLAHSDGERGKGDYIGPLKPLEKLKAILDGKQPKPVARAGR